MKYLLMTGTLFTSMAMAQPQWPEYLDVDFNYRNSALMADGQHWNLRLGVGYESEPTYQGSDRTETELDPFLLASYSADWGNLYFTGSGLGFSRLLNPNFGINLELEQEDTREIEDDERLRGLGDQDEELELEISGRYFNGPWTLDASVALATGDKGMVWFIGGSRTWRLANDRLFLTLRSDLSGSNAKNQQTDFGITAEQSQNSVIGLPEYTAGGGLKSFGVGLSMDYQFKKHWFINASIEAERLLGDVADSPLVNLIGSENNYEVGVGVYYRF